MTRTYDIHLIETSPVVGADTRAHCAPGADARTVMSLTGASAASGMAVTALTQDRNHIVLAPRGAG